MKKLIIVLGVVGTSVSSILVRFSDAPSTVLVFYRMLFAVVLLCPLLFAKGHLSEYKTLARKDLLLCILSGFCLGMHFSCYFESLKHTSISSSVVLVDTEVFFVAVGGMLLLHEKLSRIGWGCMVVTFLGSMIVAFGDLSGGGLLGDVLAVAGAVAVACYTLIGRKMREKMTTTAYTWIVYFTAAMVVLAASLFSGNNVVPISAKNLLLGLGLTIFCTLLGHSVFSWGLKYEKAAFVSTVKLMSPVFASVFGLFIFGEVPSLTTVIGGVLIIAGIVVMCRKNVSD